MATTKSIATIVGNPRPSSRTSQVAGAVAEAVAGMLGKARVLAPLELGRLAPTLLDAADVAANGAREELASADVLVVASPTYKGTYTGLLKAFLDGYGTSALKGVLAVPVMVGGAERHALAVEVHLRPLLVELGATVPTQGLFVLDSDIAQLDDIVRSWSTGAVGPIRALVGSEGARP